MLVLTFLVVLAMPLVAHAATVTVDYDEPTTVKSGEPLTNLKDVTIFWRLDQTGVQGVEQKKVIPATKPTGGGHVTNVLTVPDPTTCGPALVSIDAMATTTTGLMSPRHGWVGKTIDTTNPIPDCQRPKPTSGLQLK